MEGNSASGDLFRTNAGMFQQVYASSAFGFLGGTTGRIDGMAFRMDGGSNQSFIGIWPGISVLLSTGQRAPDSLSANYGDNAGPDAVLVYGGSLTLVAPSEAGFRSFQAVVPFQTPFLYDPSKGNLTVTIVSSAGPANLFLDGQVTVGDSVGRVFGGGAFGTPDTFGLVTRFNITPIPEPSTLAIAISFVLCFGLRKSRLSRNRGS